MSPHALQWDVVFRSPQPESNGASYGGASTTPASVPVSAPLSLPPSSVEPSVEVSAVEPSGCGAASPPVSPDVWSFPVGESTPGESTVTSVFACPSVPQFGSQSDSEMLFSPVTAAQPPANTTDQATNAKREGARTRESYSESPWRKGHLIDTETGFKRARARAPARTASNIAGVSFPVCVFCWLTW